MSKEIDVIVVGAGLSGLTCALLLHEAGKKVLVIEAQERPGGRIRSVFDKGGNFLADLGPSWVWPMFQPVISQWLSKLELSTFPQFDQGNTIVDYGPEQNPQVGFVPSQDGNERVVGGSQALIDALVTRLPADAILTNAQVSAVSTTASGGIDVTIATPTPSSLFADTVVVATPPRIATHSIEWQPELPQEVRQSLEMTPTWMAPHAKVAALYEEPFWRDQGLSGRLVSRTGPIVELNDHCGPDGSPAALWGFIGWPYETREQVGNELETAIREQLTRCFGQAPVQIQIEDWAFNPFIASAADLKGPMNHPNVGPQFLRETYFNGSIVFCASETAQRSPGLIEGAFDAGQRAAAQILAR